MARPIQTERQKLIEERILWYLASPNYLRHGIVSPSSLYFWLGHDSRTFNPHFPTQEEICIALNRLIEKGEITIRSLFVDPKLRYSDGDCHEYGGISVLIAPAETPIVSEGQEPTPDQICYAIHKILGVMQTLDGMIKSSRADMPKVPFAPNIQNALAVFDKPELRNSLVERLYHPEKYISPTKP